MRFFIEVRSIRLSLAVVLVLIDPPAEAQTTATDGRPANIPANYLGTPNGWRHPSCVHQLREGEKVDVNGDIALISTGAVVQYVSPCGYPWYDGAGNEVSAGGPPAFNDWLIDAQADAGAVFFISAYWTVPNNPASVNGQILYFWPGIMPVNADSNEIVQPVLGWNQIGTGPGWTISSWRFAYTGGSYNSPLITVNPGDQIYGYAEGLYCNQETGVCTTWVISTYDMNISTGTALWSDSMGDALYFTLGGVYEAHNLSACNQGSTSDQLVFSNVYVAYVAGGTTPS